MDKDEEEIWEVEKIVNLKTGKGDVQYLVRCTGCTELEDTWQTFDQLDDCPEKLPEFGQKFHR